ncbi:hypothetical protein EXS54_00685 [Patescibacteria group bacterium]|nr:hypothetical protein [Patescibacteria group bacterium]
MASTFEKISPEFTLIGQILPDHGSGELLIGRNLEGQTVIDFTRGEAAEFPTDEETEQLIEYLETEPESFTLMGEVVSGLDFRLKHTDDALLVVKLESGTTVLAVADRGPVAVMSPEQNDQLIAALQTCREI